MAQAYDTGDPCSGGNQCCTNGAAGQAYACIAGEAPYTGQFMGGIHPRVKKIVGMRLAKAARAVAYGDKSVGWTGPVLESCVIKGSEIELIFDPTKLAGDAIMVHFPRAFIRTKFFCVACCVICLRRVPVARMRVIANLMPQLWPPIGSSTLFVVNPDVCIQRAAGELDSGGAYATTADGPRFADGDPD